MHKKTLFIITLLYSSFILGMKEPPSAPDEVWPIWKVNGEDGKFILESEVAFLTKDSPKKYILTEPLRPCIAIVIHHPDFVVLMHHSFYTNPGYLEPIVKNLLPDGTSSPLKVSLYTHYQEEFHRHARIYGFANQEEMLADLKGFLGDVLEFHEHSIKVFYRKKYEGEAYLTLGVDKSGTLFHVDIFSNFKTCVDAALVRIHGKTFADEGKYYETIEPRVSAIQALVRRADGAPVMQESEAEHLGLKNWPTIKSRSVCQRKHCFQDATIACPSCPAFYCSTKHQKDDKEPHKHVCKKYDLD